jgi:putative oxidoreductase
MTDLRSTGEASALSPAGAADHPAFRGLAAPLLAIARVMLVYIFIVEGAGKISSDAGLVAYMQAAGVDGRLLPLVISTELGGGLCVLTGLATRLAAVALSGFCLLTAIVFHLGADQAIEFPKNVAIARRFFDPRRLRTGRLVRRRLVGTAARLAQDDFWTNRAAPLHSTVRRRRVSAQEKGVPATPCNPAAPARAPRFRPPVPSLIRTEIA